MVGSKLLMLANISSDIPWNDNKENGSTLSSLVLTCCLLIIVPRSGPTQQPAEPEYAPSALIVIDTIALYELDYHNVQ